VKLARQKRSKSRQRLGDESFRPRGMLNEWEAQTRDCWHVRNTHQHAACANVIVADARSEGKRRHVRCITGEIAIFDGLCRSLAPKNAMRCYPRMALADG